MSSNQIVAFILAVLSGCTTPGDQEQGSGLVANQSSIEVAGDVQAGYTVTGYHRDSIAYFRYSDSPSDTVQMKIEAIRAVEVPSR